MEEGRWLTLYAAIAWLSVAAAYALDSSVSVGWTLFFLFLVAWMGWSLLRTLWWIAALIREGEDQPLRRITPTGLRAAAEDQVARLGPLMMVPVFTLYFPVLKGIVPLFGGYRMDGVLAATDRFIFGTDPWRLTHAVLEPYTGLIDAAYIWWMPVVFGACFVVAAFGGAKTRARFFLSWMLGWVLLGVFGAALLASAGPLFVGELHLPGAAHFSGLIERLNQHQHLLLFVERAYLLNLEAGHASALGGGISAAPSMHVAIATLLFLASPKWGRLVTGAFLAIIAMGSVHLGWHYATDGILGALGMVLIWNAAGAWLEAPARAAVAV